MIITEEILEHWQPESGSDESADSEIQVIDFFSGCGGMSLGFSAVGQQTGAFELVGAADINNTSLTSYNRNFSVPAIECDVRDLVASEDELKSFIDKLPARDPDKPLVLIGCAPCQGFSAHSKKRWSMSDMRNSLVAVFGLIAQKLSPECVIMENVPELLSGRYWNHFERFRDSLTEAGYTVKQAIHNAAEYGVPQERFRALVVAMRKPNFSLPRPMLTPDNFRTVRDAIGDLQPVKAGRALPEDKMHKSAGHRESTLDVIRAVPKNGGSRPAGIGPKCLDRVKGFYDVYGRLSWDKPSITITHYARNPASGRFIHPEQDRGLTMREAARLQGFPDDYVFEGTFDDVFRQIGEAVPPPLATAVALSVLSNLRGEKDEGDDILVEQPVSDSYASVIAGIKRRP